MISTRRDRRARTRRRTRAAVVAAGLVLLVSLAGVVIASQRGPDEPAFVQPTAATPSLSPGPPPTGTTAPEPSTGLGTAVAAPPPSDSEPSEPPDQAGAGGSGPAEAAGEPGEGRGEGEGGGGGSEPGGSGGGGSGGGGPADPGDVGPARVAPGDFPDASTTGPVSADLRSVGDLRADEPGAVYEGLEIGCVDVYADGVTIRDSVIRCDRDTYPVYNRASDLVLVDVEIDGQGAASNCIAHSRYTLVRAELHGCKDGARANGDVVIRDSYIHSLVRVPGGHHDVIQSTKGENITIEGNTLIAITDGRNMNAAYMAGSAQGPLDRVYVVGNYITGGNYSLQIDPGITDGRYEDNVFGRDAQYGAVPRVPDSVVWRNNRLADTGAPVPVGGW